MPNDPPGSLKPRMRVNGDASKPGGELEGSDDEKNLVHNDGTLTDHLEIKMRQLHLGDATEKVFLGKVQTFFTVEASKVAD